MHQNITFANSAARKEFLSMPDEVKDDFAMSLYAIMSGKRPYLPTSRLKGALFSEFGVLELKINGSPAFRCVYSTRRLGKVYVLHTFKKTTNGTDRKAMAVATKRLKELRAITC